jgi:hypothetical protein
MALRDQLHTLNLLPAGKDHPFLVAWEASRDRQPLLALYRRNLVIQKL